MIDENIESDPNESGVPQAAPDDASGMDSAGGAGKKTLGLERWVQVGYLVTSLLVMWLSGHLISTVWYAFADPNEAIVTVASVAVGLASGILLYRHQQIYTLSHDVADELSKVTWPTRSETSNSTVVVIVTSIIAAMFLGFFDAIWSTVTDLVYKV